MRGEGSKLLTGKSGEGVPDGEGVETRGRGAEESGSKDGVGGEEAAVLGGAPGGLAAVREEKFKDCAEDDGASKRRKRKKRTKEKERKRDIIREMGKITVHLKKNLIMAHFFHY